MKNVLVESYSQESLFPVHGLTISLNPSKIGGFQFRFKRARQNLS